VNGRKKTKISPDNPDKCKWTGPDKEVPQYQSPLDIMEDTHSKGEKKENPERGEQSGFDEARKTWKAGKQNKKNSRNKKKESPHK